MATTTGITNKLPKTCGHQRMCINICQTFDCSTKNKTPCVFQGKRVKSY